MKKELLLKFMGITIALLNASYSLNAHANEQITPDHLNSIVDQIESRVSPNGMGLNFGALSGNSLPASYLAGDAKEVFEKAVQGDFQTQVEANVVNGQKVITIMKPRNDMFGVPFGDYYIFTQKGKQIAHANINYTNMCLDWDRSTLAILERSGKYFSPWEKTLLRDTTESLAKLGKDYPRVLAALKGAGGPLAKSAILGATALGALSAISPRAEASETGAKVTTLGSKKSLSNVLQKQDETRRSDEAGSAILQ
jgi:hypothetical protein